MHNTDKVPQPSGGLSELGKQRLNAWLEKWIRIFGGVENFVNVFKGPTEIINGIIERGEALNLTANQKSYQQELINNRQDAERFVAGKIGMM